MVSGGLGLILLAIGGVAVFRAQAATRRLARILAIEAQQESALLTQTLDQLNQHGIELQHTTAELAPRLQQWSTFFNSPVISAAMPWFLRRLFFRPLRRGA